MQRYFLLIALLSNMTVRAQQSGVDDEQLWYFQPKTWLLAAVLILILLLGIYRLFKPKRKKDPQNMKEDSDQSQEENNN